MIEDLRQRLLEMCEEDHRVREELAATGELFEGYAPRMAEVHSRNAAELRKILDQYGWPGKSLVGEEGAEAAWLILHHAIGNPDLQRNCRAVLQNAVSKGEADPAQLAYLEDRICLLEGRPQRYGTQFDWDENGEMNPWNLEDPDHVEEYRQAVGLGPLPEELARIRRNLGNEKPPTDYKKRQAKMILWAKSVGWR